MAGNINLGQAFIRLIKIVETGMKKFGVESIDITQYQDVLHFEIVTGPTIEIMLKYPESKFYKTTKSNLLNMFMITSSGLNSIQVDDVEGDISNSPKGLMYYFTQGESNKYSRLNDLLAKYNLTNLFTDAEKDQILGNFKQQITYNEQNAGGVITMFVMLGAAITSIVLFNNEIKHNPSQVTISSKNSQPKDSFFSQLETWWKSAPIKTTTSGIIPFQPNSQENATQLENKINSLSSDVLTLIQLVGDNENNVGLFVNIMEQIEVINDKAVALKSEMVDEVQSGIDENIAQTLKINTTIAEGLESVNDVMKDVKSVLGGRLGQIESAILKLDQNVVELNKCLSLDPANVSQNNQNATSQMALTFTVSAILKSLEEAKQVGRVEQKKYSQAIIDNLAIEIAHEKAKRVVNLKYIENLEAKIALLEKTPSLVSNSTSSNSSSTESSLPETEQYSIFRFFIDFCGCLLLLGIAVFKSQYDRFSNFQTRSNAAKLGYSNQRDEDEIRLAQNATKTETKDIQDKARTARAAARTASTSAKLKLLGTKPKGGRRKQKTKKIRKRNDRTKRRIRKGKQQKFMTKRQKKTQQNRNK